jgi:hypothetical protein
MYGSGIVAEHILLMCTRTNSKIIGHDKALLRCWSHQRYDLDRFRPQVGKDNDYIITCPYQITQTFGFRRFLQSTFWIIASILWKDKKIYIYYSMQHTKAKIVNYGVVNKHE